MLIKIVLGSCLGPHSKFCTVEKLPVISVEDDAYGVAHLVRHLICEFMVGKSRNVHSRRFEKPLICERVSEWQRALQEMLAHLKITQDIHKMSEDI